MFKSQRSYIKWLSITCIAVFVTAYAIMHIDVINDNIVKFFSVLTPFYIGFTIAYILNRPIKLLKSKLKLKGWQAITITYLMLIVFISLFSAYVVPQVIDNSIALGNEITKGVSQLVTTFETFDYGPLQSFFNDNISRLAEILTSVSNFIVVNLSAIFLAVTGTFMNIIFGFVISIYMLIDKDKIATLFKRVISILLGVERAQTIIDYLNQANTVFSHFISGLIVEALAVGALAFIGFELLGVRYSIILALVITFTNIIPYVGPFIGAIPAVTVTLLYDPFKALWVGIFIVILQQVDGNFIGPKIMGNYIGLDPIWVILSITIGGRFFGVLGVLLAIPTGAFLKIVLSNLLNQYNDARGNV